MGVKLQAKIDDENEMEDGEQGRQRSKVAFPYGDLKAAIEVANAIHQNVGNSACSLQQLSAWMNMSIKSSGFRILMAVGRLFGLIESSSSEDYRLTALGRRVVDPQSARKAKSEAFLSVPLFKLLYENHKEGLLPPPAALEHEIAGVGVAEKQKDRARQVFERSAEQAGFFEHGKNRLVMPAMKGGDQQHKEHREAEHSGASSGGSGNSGNNIGSTGQLDPVVSALIQKLPSAKATEWLVDERVTWLQMMTMAFQMAYGSVEPIEVKKAGFL